MRAKSLVASLIATSLLTVAAPASASTPMHNGEPCGQCTTNADEIRCWTGQSPGWQPTADPTFATWRATRVRQRSDGRWEVAVGTDTSSEPSCVEVLPGTWVAPADAPDVRLYLKARALEAQGLVEIAGEEVPDALDLWNWTHLAACESTGRWHLRDGGVQIIPSTWRAYGGQEFAPLAGGATVAEQITVARRVLTAGGESQWECDL